MRGELGAQLLDDHGGPPGRLFLGAQNISVDVIPDVQHAGATNAEQPLEFEQIAALVNAAALDATTDVSERVAVTLHERAALAKPGRLLCGDHHRIKVVPPG